MSGDIKINKLFGINEKRESQLRNFFAKENLRSNTITELAKNVELLKGEETYIAYLFGRQIQRNEQLKFKAEIKENWWLHGSN